MRQPRTSAGLLMYRVRHGDTQVFIAHPGGPYFRRKDDGHWTIPKGEIEPGEDLLAAARREFREEIGIEPTGDWIDLGSITQKGGKIVHAWGFAGDWDESKPPQSNTIPIEWPPGSGRFQDFPEVDRAEFFSISEARKKLKDAQHPFLDRLQAALAG